MSFLIFSLRFTHWIVSFEASSQLDEFCRESSSQLIASLQLSLSLVTVVSAADRTFTVAGVSDSPTVKGGRLFSFFPYRCEKHIYLKSMSFQQQISRLKPSKFSPFPKSTFFIIYQFQFIFPCREKKVILSTFHLPFFCIISLFHFKIQIWKVLLSSLLSSLRPSFFTTFFIFFLSLDDRLDRVGDSPNTDMRQTSQ